MSQQETPAPDSAGLPPPPGTTPYFDDPFSLQPYQTVTVAGAAISTTVMVIARLYTKQYLIKTVNFEDYSCVLGWLCFIAYLGIQESVGFHGGGVHQWNVRYQDVQYNFKLNNYGDMLYSMSLLATKLSIMLLIKRVFCSVKRDVAYWLTILLMFVNTGFYFAFIIVATAECLPRSKLWNNEEAGKCLDIFKLYIASSVFNLLSDIAMLSVLIYLVWRLQMSIRRKVGISAIFCTGGLACISSMARWSVCVRLTLTQDYTFTHLQGALWGMAEIAFGLLCSCLIALPRLYQHFCDITPYTAQNMAETTDPRSHTTSNGKSKREWVQLEEQAERARRKFSTEARLGDEEAIDVALDGDDLNSKRG